MRHSKRQKTQLEETDQASEPDMAGMLHLSNWELKTQFNNYDKFRVSLVAQMVKSLPAIQETWVQSLGWEDHLEKEMATHSSILAWKIPWMEEPCRQQSMRSQQSQTGLSNFTSLRLNLIIFF